MMIVCLSFPELLLGGGGGWASCFIHQKRKEHGSDRDHSLSLKVIRVVFENNYFIKWKVLNRKELISQNREQFYTSVSLILRYNLLILKSSC